MKICPNCKAENGDNDRFCAHCGAGLPEQPEAPQAQAAPQAPETIPYVPTYQPSVMPGEDHTISTGKWVLYQLIPLIPFVGGIAYIVMLFVWGFGENKNETFRNWARSNLILMLISIVLVVVLLVVFGSVLAAILSNGDFSPHYPY